MIKVSPNSFVAGTSGDGGKFWGMDEKTFCMSMHLSQFAGCIVPLAGLILPVVMWATNKDQSPMIDQHGRNIFNFMNQHVYL